MNGTVNMMNVWKMKTGLMSLFAGAMFVCGSASVAMADYLPEDSAQDQEVDSVESVGNYLASDLFVLSRLELRKYSADVVADLVQISETDRFGKQAQSRALQSLALYAREDDRASASLRDALDRFKPGHALCPTAIIAFGEAFGEDAVSSLEGMATHKRADVRMAVVVALGRFGGQAGMEKLIELSANEEHEAVKARIESYIQ